MLRTLRPPSLSLLNKPFRYIFLRKHFRSMCSLSKNHTQRQVLSLLTHDADKRFGKHAFVDGSLFTWGVFQGCVIIRACSFTYYQIIMLDSLDKELKSRDYHFVRYAEIVSLIIRLMNIEAKWLSTFFTFYRGKPQWYVNQTVGEYELSMV